MQRKVDRITKEGKSSEVELTQAMELEVMALCKIKQCHECKKYGHNIHQPQIVLFKQRGYEKC